MAQALDKNRSLRFYRWLLLPSIFSQLKPIREGNSQTVWIIKNLKWNLNRLRQPTSPDGCWGGKKKRPPISWKWELSSYCLKSLQTAEMMGCPQSTLCRMLLHGREGAIWTFWKKVGSAITDKSRTWDYSFLFVRFSFCCNYLIRKLCFAGTFEEKNKNRAIPNVIINTCAVPATSKCLQWIINCRLVTSHEQHCSTHHQFELRSN